MAGLPLTVVKVGGGLARGAGDDALRAVCETLGELSARHALLIVPGGARFADAVREADRTFGLSDRAAHEMAILAMEQFGWLLSELMPGAERRRDVDGTGVLLPAGLPLDLPASWEVTSDSIAAWVALRARATRLVLVKDVAGLQGNVDDYLPTILKRATFETWVISGRDPGRLAELLDSGQTVGTRIAPARLVR